MLFPNTTPLLNHENSNWNLYQEGLTQRPNFVEYPKYKEHHAGIGYVLCVTPIYTF